MLKDLCVVQNNPSIDRNDVTFVDNNLYPYFTRTLCNNGIYGYINYVDEKHKIKGNCLAVGMMGMQFFYMNKDFYSGQFTKRVEFLGNNFDETIKLFICTVLNTKQQLFKDVLVRNFISTFYNTNIPLPEKINKLDMKSMLDIIKQIKINKYEKIKLYNDNKLAKYIKKENYKKIDFYKEQKFNSYKLEELFEKVKINKLKYKTSDLPTLKNEKYCLPVLTAGIQNQGLNFYCPKDNATILKNMITISANGANTGATFYQNKEFTVLQDAFALKWKLKYNLNELQYLYLVTLISNKIYGTYTWSDKANWNKIKSINIKLPVLDDMTIDFNFMEQIMLCIYDKITTKINSFISTLL